MNIFKLRYWIVIIVFVITRSNISAQFYINGTDNPCKKLKQIDTDHFCVVFPSGYEYEGNKLANILEQATSLVSNSLDHQLNKKIPVLLHTGYSYPNGFVVWAPSRSELFNLPPQDSYSQDWLEQLSVHEMRHVIQVNKIEEGVPKLLKILFGEGALGIIAGLFPLWAYEGDAVIAETALTGTGRGRSPSFLMGLKAISSENLKPYSYEKAIFGSYKDFVPSHYVYGYAMSAMARIKYDSSFWSNALDYIPRRPYTLYPLFFFMHKNYGSSKQKLYHESIQLFKNEWDQNKENHVTYKPVNNLDKKEYINYRFPVITENGKIICEKSEKSNIKKYVEINALGEEHVISVPGNYTSTRLSYGDGKLVWAEIKIHPRWELEQQSTIKIFDIHSKKITTIGKGSRYVAPAIDQSGKKIVAIEAGLSKHENIVIFNLNNAQVENTIPVEKGTVQKPSWHPDQNKIVYTKIDETGIGIEIMDLSSGMKQQVFGPEKADISSPVFWKEFVLFSASFNGTDNIYALNIDSKELFQVTFSRYGAFDPVVFTNTDSLFFSEYSSQGYNVVFQKLNPAKFSPFDTGIKYEPDIVKSLAKQEKNKFISDPENYINFNKEKYQKWKHLVNIHSWIPFYTEPDPVEIIEAGIYPGLTTFTQNLTGTLYGWAGYSYRGPYHYGNINLTYRGFWPVISVNYEIGGKPEIIAPDQEDFPGTLQANKQKIDLNTYIPLFFNKGAVYFRMQPGMNLTYEDIYIYHPDSHIYESGLTNLQYNTAIFVYSKMAERDIYPKYGVFTRGRYYHTPFENKYGNMYNLSLRLYLPGIEKNHSLRFLFQYQQQDNIYEFFRYPYSLSFPRGYYSQISNKLKMFALDYTFPFLYPDWRIGPLIYFKRFKANLFFDQAFAAGILSGDGQDPYIDEFYRSYGIELSTDLHVAHIPLPFSVGIRAGFKPEDGATIIQPIFSFNLNDL